MSTKTVPCYRCLEEIEVISESGELIEPHLGYYIVNAEGPREPPYQVWGNQNDINGRMPGMGASALVKKLLCDNCWCFECEREIGARSFSRLSIQVRCPHHYCKHCLGIGVREMGCENCHACMDTCECFACNDCGHNRNPEDYRLCQTCDYGSCCCNCNLCESCSEYISSSNYCCGCERCHSCCGCAEMHSGVEMSEHDYEPTFHACKTRRGRFISAEIEVAKSDFESAGKINDVLNRWDAKAVEDGSIPEEGYEINTAPAQNREFERQVKDISKVLLDNGGSVDASCGVHLHFDARDLHYSDLKKILMVYLFVEDDLFKMLPPSRQNNRFCLRVQKADYAKNAFMPMASKQWRTDLVDKMYGKKGERPMYSNFRKEKYHQSRYFALNFHSFFYRKTIEFRHHAGTIRADKIIAWARICESILDFASKTGENDIKKHFLNVKPGHNLMSILKPELVTYYKARRVEFNCPVIEPEYHFIPTIPQDTVTYNLPF